MKIRFFSLLACLAWIAILSNTSLTAFAAVPSLISSRPLDSSQVPTLISYQGYVTVDDQPYTGTGYFKFAILDDAGASRWSNDGSSTNGSQPLLSVERPVTHGVFSIYLGNTNIPGMTQAFSADVFDGSALFLRIWFSADNLNFTLLSPDRGISPVAYAVWAKTAANASLLDGLDSLDFALSGHTHNTLYAALNHAHNDLYAALTHDHDDDYVNDDDGEVDDNDIAQGTLSPDRINGTAWTADNDGTASGLDADLLDGQQGSYYQRRVGASCAAGSTIQGIAADGSVICEPHITRPRYTDVTAPNQDWYVGMDPTITIGRDGLPVISFRYQYDWGQGQLKFTRCLDLNCNQSTTHTLRQGNDTGFSNEMTIGSDGNPIIVFIDSGFTTGNLYVLHCQDADCQAFSTQTLEPAGTLRNSPSIAIGTDGLPILSYYDATNQNLLVAHCTDADCSAISTQTVATSLGTESSFTSIAIGIDGLPLISYYARADTSLRLVHCGNLDCSTGNVLRVLDGAGVANSGFYNRLAIGMDGLPVIAYTYVQDDGYNNQLKFLHCADISCASVSEYQLLTSESAGNYGVWPSLVIGSDGFPTITHYDWDNEDLEFVHCWNVNCSSTLQFTLKSDGKQGTYSSVTIGADGLPIIAYHNGTNLEMRVLHCANQTCTPNWSRR